MRGLTGIGLVGILAIVLHSSVSLAQGKLLATAGVTQVEGAGGGGLVPWAVLAGYDSRDEVSVSVHTTRVRLDDYSLQTYGAALGLFDRVELTAAHQRFQLDSLSGHIRQTVLGAKLRLYGDVVYSRLPQISVGAFSKRLLDGDIAGLLGADRNIRDTDYYLSLTKVHLGLVNGYNLLWNYTLRSTRANELGLLGFGSASDTSRDLLHEGSAAILLSRQLAIGAEYRQKPDRLGLGESDWQDVFVAWVPDKRWNITFAYADLGTIAGVESQDGFYASITGYLY